MCELVRIKKGDYICVDVVTNTLWIEKGKDIQTRPPSPAPRPPDIEKGETNHHFPTGKLFFGEKSSVTWNIAYTLAYAVAWESGLRPTDCTDHFLGTKGTYIFKVV